MHAERVRILRAGYVSRAYASKARASRAYASRACPSRACPSRACPSRALCIEGGIEVASIDDSRQGREYRVPWPVQAAQESDE